MLQVKNRLKELRLQCGLSQTALAEAAGTTKRTIHAIETKNQDIHISLAHRLARCLGCGIADLFVFDDRIPSTTDMAIWFTYAVSYLAKELNKTNIETVRLLRDSGLADKLIEGYDVWHTQGFGYITEMLSQRLSEEIS